VARKHHDVIDLEPGAGGRKRWIVLLVLIAVAGAGVWYWTSNHRTPARPAVVSQATDVRSNVSQEGDSLDIIVEWRLTEAPATGQADSVRVEVGVGQGDNSVVTTSSALQRSDTLRLPAPAPGGTVAGYSCVTPVRLGRLARQSCTPWQYVRPSAAPASSPADSLPGKASRENPARIVVQPGGMQVDPDVNGRCAEWQRAHPDRSVWIDVNRRAVPQCTGPNGKPTVAQFCAFAVLRDGRRMKTANSTNDPYCERLFQEWIRERYS
jgi:hypothetical protein